MSDSSWKVFDFETEFGKQVASNRPYREFLRVPSLSCGIYTLAAGAKDLQGPHDEDEVYYVARGKGRVRVDGREAPVGPGSPIGPVGPVAPVGPGSGSGVLQAISWSLKAW